MPCEHMKKLYQLCSDSGIRLSSTDLIRIACKECGDTEVCPSVLLDEYETKATIPLSNKQTNDAHSTATEQVDV